MPELTRNQGKSLSGGKVKQTVTYTNSKGSSTGTYIRDTRNGTVTPVAADYKKKTSS